MVDPEDFHPTDDGDEDDAYDVDDERHLRDVADTDRLDELAGHMRAVETKDDALSFYDHLAGR